MEGGGLSFLIRIDSDKATSLEGKEGFGIRPGSASLPLPSSSKHRTLLFHVFIGTPVNQSKRRKGRLTMGLCSPPMLLLMVLIGHISTGLSSSNCHHQRALHQRMDTVEKRLDDSIQLLESEVNLLLDVLEGLEHHTLQNENVHSFDLLDQPPGVESQCYARKSPTSQPGRYRTHRYIKSSLQRRVEQQRNKGIGIEPLVSESRLQATYFNSVRLEELKECSFV
ncbi:hypothetical protein DNTS_015963 [Danionella cerebrum]|uniref:Uncharacterized protein n=1 Tax=Danionella cerebrum TaxID=2873325 RepID=A0A553RHG6_9TELE|nr:hypothetical protein DNTS_015963 [Danionella translucida]